MDTGLLLRVQVREANFNLVPARKSASRGEKGTATQKRADRPRTHYLVADFTDEEKARVLDYCRRHGMSVSQFLATIAIGDVTKSHGKPKQESITTTLPAGEVQKLAILARLKEKSVEQLIQELILEATSSHKQPVSDLKTRNLTYYLREKEHRLLKQHIQKKGVSIKNYVATLALDVISKEQKSK